MNHHDTGMMRIDRQNRLYSMIMGDGVYGHVVKRTPTKKRGCLRCQNVFTSMNGKRLCGACFVLNTRRPARASI